MPLKLDGGEFNDLLVVSAMGRGMRELKYNFTIPGVESKDMAFSTLFCLILPDSVSSLVSEIVVIIMCGIYKCYTSVS